MPARSQLGRAPEAILAATERLLAERPLHELRVAEIIAAAGVSRSSFYAHFDSKAAVIAECLRRALSEITLAFEPVHATADDGLEAAIRASLRSWARICERHGALLLAASEEWPADRRLGEPWLAMLTDVAAGTARLVDDLRARGLAPAGADPAALSDCLTWGFERVLQVALAGGAEGLEDAGAIVEPLTQMMLGGLFGRAPARPGAGIEP